MPFKFTLLGLEISNRRNTCEDNKMVKKTKLKKRSSHQKKFGKAVKKCHAITKTPNTFGKCMRKELKK